jgi:hypothetical protein
VTKSALLLALVVAACATPREPAPAEATTGVAGTLCRAVVPESARQGDVVEAVVEVTTPPGASRPDDARRYAVLVLSGADGVRIEVEPYDPDCGMPSDPPAPPGADGASARVQDASFHAAFPLARAWDALPPGRYRGEVEVWWHPRVPGEYTERVCSSEFDFRIEPAAPREETFLLPKSLRVVETTFTTRDDGTETTIPLRQVVYGKDDAEEIRLPRRNGFFLGTNLLRDDVEYGGLGGRTIEPDGANPIDSSYGSGPEAQKLGAAYTIVIFETADVPEHMWHPGPGSGGYRELWRRTIAPISSNPPEQSLAVHVAAPDGTPIGDAVVDAWRLGPGGTSRRRRTDATGVVVFDKASPERYRVSLAAWPGVPEEWMNSQSEDPAVAAYVDVGGGTARIDLVAPRVAAFEVVADERDFPDGVRPWIDVIHRFPGGTWSHGAHQTSWNATRPGDGRIVWRVTNAPAGRYSVTVFAKGHASSTSEVDVLLGEKPPELRMKPGEPVAPIELVYDGPPLTRDHFFTMASAERAQHDVAHGTFAGTPPSAVVTQARPGHYMLTLWRSGAAMVLDVPDGGDRRVAVSVPAWTAPAPDAHGTDVTVAVTRGGTPITRMMVAIAPASDEPLRSGKWLRTTDAWPGKFAAVPPGDWDVFVFDGVYGEWWYGFEPSPRVRRVRVGADPVTVRFDL